MVDILQTAYVEVNFLKMKILHFHSISSFLSKCSVDFPSVQLTH